MIVDAQARFISQRDYPNLQSVSVSLGESGIVLERGEERLVVARPTSEPVLVRVWKDELAALDAGDEAANWLSDVVGAPVRLVEQSGERAIDPSYAHGQVSFADGFPLLIITDASIRELAARAGIEVDARRFRPNVVVSGAAPFAEDRWRVLEVGGVTVDLVKPCSRCPMVNVDPDSAEVGPEPLRSLATYRRTDLGVIVGQNAVHRGPGRIRVGHPVRILERESERASAT
jgi:hypothetical protein